MRILLDECIDQRLRRDIQGHYVDHVRHLGWASLDDGALLRRAAGAAFDAFVTVDRGFAFQQDLTAIPIAIMILRVKRNTRASLQALLPALLDKLTVAAKGAVTWVERR